MGIIESKGFCNIISSPLLLNQTDKLLLSKTVNDLEIAKTFNQYFDYFFKNLHITFWFNAYTGVK